MNRRTGLFEGFAKGAGQAIRSFFARSSQQAAFDLQRGGTPSVERAGMPYTLVSQFGYDTLAEHLRIDQDLQARYTDAEEMDEYPEVSCISSESLVIFLGVDFIPRNNITGEMSVTEVSSRSIGDLAKDYEEGKHDRLFVYAFDHESQKVVVAEARGPVSKGVKPVYRVTYENYRKDKKWSVKATGDHLFMLREGDYRPVESLKPGDRIMPCTFKVQKNGYLAVYEPMQKTDSGNPRYTNLHNLVSQAMCGRALLPGECTHHRDGDKTNARPSNLEILTRKAHIHHHQKGEEERARRAKISRAASKQWDDEHRLKMSKAHQRDGGGSWLQKEKSGGYDSRENKTGHKLSEAHRKAIGDAQKITISRDVLEAALRASTSLNQAAKKLGVSWNTVVRRMADHGIDRSIMGSNLHGPQPGDEEYLNHRIVSVEYVGEEEVFDLEVPEYRNFAVGDGDDGFVFVHNCALDIYADDTCTPDLEKEQAIWATSKDKAVADELNEVLHKRLLVEDDIWGNARTVCKYGNSFGELLVDDTGLVGVNYLPPPTTRRVESPRGQLLGFIQDVRGEFNLSLEDFYTLAQQRGEGSEVIRGRAPGELSVFEDWEVVHWRLRGKHLRSIYGHAVIDPARWIWKRLSLLEDALLIYKLERAPSRYAFYIDVGELDAERGLAHVNRVKNAFTRKKFVNPSTGKLDMRYNPLCLHGKTEIPLLTGEVKTIESMVDDFERGEEQWVWSVDLEDEGKLRPGRVEWAGKTRRDAQLVKVTLDNGEFVVVTPDHKMIRRDCSKVEAQHLQPGDSLMPFRRRISSKEKGETLEGYELVYCPQAQRSLYGHHVVAADLGIKAKGQLIHHEDFDTLQEANTRKVVSIHRHMLTKMAREEGYEDFDSFRKAAIDDNHKVVSVEWLEERADTFTLTVGESHTFALSAGVFVMNSHDEDFFVPVRGGKRTTEIEVIQGPDYSEVESLEYHRDKLVAALKIPKSYMGYGGEAAPRALSTDDIRFARTVMRVQRVLRGGYRKAMRVHLIARGMESVDKVDFDVHMSVPSAILELARVEVMSTTADLASRMAEQVSTKWLLTHLYKFSEDEAVAVMKEKDEEAVQRGQIEAQVQMLQNAAMGGGGGLETSMDTKSASGGAPALSEVQQMEARLSRLITARPRYNWRREFEKGNGASERRADDKLDKLLRENVGLNKRLREVGGLLTEVRRTMRDGQTAGYQ